MNLKKISQWILAFSFVLSTAGLAENAKTGKTNSTAPDRAKKMLLTYEQFQRLQSSKKITYMTAIREFLVRADFSNDPFFKTSLLNLFIENSYAVDENSVCIFAGFLQKMKRSGSGRWYCPKPKGNCPEGQVPCNRLPFGTPHDFHTSEFSDKDICVGEAWRPGQERFKNATEECAMKSDGSLNTIVAGIDKEAWKKFNDDVTAYCADPFPFNKENCVTLTEQLNRVNYRLNNSTPGAK